MHIDMKSRFNFGIFHTDFKFIIHVYISVKSSLDMNSTVYRTLCTGLITLLNNTIGMFYIFYDLKPILIRLNLSY